MQGHPVLQKKINIRRQFSTRTCGAWHEYAAWQRSWSTIMWSFLTLEHVQSQPAAFNAAVILLTACYAQGPACVISHQACLAQMLATRATFSAHKEVFMVRDAGQSHASMSCAYLLA